MQLSVLCAGSEFFDIVISATEESLVSDIIKMVAEEWGVNDEVHIELSYNSEMLPATTRLVSHGVVAESQLTACMVRIFGKSWFREADTREKLLLYEQSGDKVLRLDTPTFAIENRIEFDAELLPVDILNVSFVIHKSPSSITEVSKDFFAKSSVTSINLSSFSTVTSIGDGFLCECESVTEINISGLRNVINIGDDFIRRCTVLEQIDLSSLIEVKHLGNGFLCECELLRSISNDGGLKKVETIGSDYLRACKSLESVDISCFEIVTEIGHHCMYQCEDLKFLTKENGFKELKKVGSHLLMGCQPLVIT